MSKNNCDFINDLLPLYADGVCSEESRRIVTEHIADCSSCRSELEKMNREIVIDADNDIQIVKRIKKRIRTEKITVVSIITIAILVVIFSILIWLINSSCTMNYEKYNLAQNVYVEENENGDIWLVKKGAAAEAWLTMPGMISENGAINAVGKCDADFDKENVNALCFTLKERIITSFAIRFPKIESNSESEWNKERTLILNVNENDKIDKIYYYDDKNDKEYLLWERN